MKALLDILKSYINELKKSLVEEVFKGSFLENILK